MKLARKVYHSKEFPMSSILLVDDSPDFLNVLQWSLQRKGFKCDTAYYRDRIFDKLANAPPDLIIMDIDLNREDGRNICREIKSNPETMLIQIFLISGNHDLLENYAQYLANDFIQKPFEMSTILQKIEKHLRN